MSLNDGSDTTEYKNIHLWDKQPIRLYNLKDDPHENHNLISKTAERPELQAAVERLTSWLPKIQAGEPDRILPK